MAEHDYGERLRHVKAQLITSSLQKRRDLDAIRLIRQYTEELVWEPIDDLLIDAKALEYVLDKQYDLKLVFSHPDVLLKHPTTSLYYRGLSGLSLKAVRDYCGSVDALEGGKPRARIDRAKAIRMARTYNAFISSVIVNSTSWTLSNGYRNVVATMGITLDGIMRNKVGEIAEDRVRLLILEWLLDHDLVIEPPMTKEQIRVQYPRTILLRDDIAMTFSADPDVSFRTNSDRKLLAIVEIKGGIDPAGALERYGAFMKTFQAAREENPRCKNFLIAAEYTSELTKRLDVDPMIEKAFDLVQVLGKPESREDFMLELFQYALRIYSRGLT